MKELTTKEFKALTMNENNLDNTSFGEFIYGLEDIFLGVDECSDASLEQVVSFFEAQDTADTWYIPFKNSMYIQFKPAEIRADHNILRFARQCLEIMVHKNTSGVIPEKLKIFKVE